MPSRALVFGSRGKMGSAVCRAMGPGWDVLPVDRAALDLDDHEAVRRFVARAAPDVVVNAVVFGGVDACELDPQRAFAVNTLFPKLLAELSEASGFTLVHFSSDAVFPDARPGEPHTESSPAGPPNVYGLSKFGADCLLRASAARAFVLRLSVLFGPRRGQGQFLERLLGMALARKEELKVSDDIVVSPSHSLDVAARVRELLESGLAPGLYHVANEGSASLHELVSEAVSLLGLSTRVEAVSHTCFPGRGRRNLRTPIRSEKIPPLRPWREALGDYCRALARESESTHGR